MIEVESAHHVGVDLENRLAPEPVHLGVGNVNLKLGCDVLFLARIVHLLLGGNDDNIHDLGVGVRGVFGVDHRKSLSDNDVLLSGLWGSVGVNMLALYSGETLSACSEWQHTKGLGPLPERLTGVGPVLKGVTRVELLLGARCEVTPGIRIRRGGRGVEVVLDSSSEAEVL